VILSRATLTGSGPTSVATGGGFFLASSQRVRSIIRAPDRDAPGQLSCVRFICPLPLIGRGGWEEEPLGMRMCVRVCVCAGLLGMG
jgi:hypothetical protein